VMQLLFAKGADAKITSKDGSTPLLAAAGVGPGGRVMGNFGVSGKTTTPADRIKAIQMCLDHGADINATDGIGQTAAHGAAGLGADEIIQFLSDHGGKLDVKDTRKRSPLDVANAVPLPGPPMQGPKLEKHESTAALIRKLLGMPEETSSTTKPAEEKAEAKPVALTSAGR